MKPVLDAAKKIQDYLDETDLQFCFIGGIALLRWGMPRLTNDADVTVFTGFGNENSLIEKMLAMFESRIENADEFALRNRVLLLKVDNVGIDVSLGALPFEQNAVERGSLFEFVKGISLRTCSAEDLIVFKAFADRPQDWIDVTSVLKVQAQLDWKYINEQLAPLVELKEQPEILTKLAELRKTSF
jgi:hypothetical protein